MIEIKEELEKRKIEINKIPKKAIDLTKNLAKTKCNFINKGIKAGKELYGINLSDFKGIIGKELMENYRFGTEIASKVKSISGLKG